MSKLYLDIIITKPALRSVCEPLLYRIILLSFYEDIEPNSYKPIHP